MQDANEGCIFFCILCEYRLGWDVYHEKEEKKENRELLKR